MKWLIVIPLLFACSIPALAVAGCSGASPNWTANDATSTSTQDCANETLACGDTITIPAGTATWTTEVTLTPPTGCPAYTGAPGTSPAVVLQFSTTCLYGCVPGSGGISGKGTVNTSGTAVTWVSGTQFNTGWSGQIQIGSTVYMIASVNSATSITLTATAGSNTGATYAVPLIFQNNTNITMSVVSNPALNVPSCSSTSFVRITGLAATMTISGSAIQGAINVTCSHGQVGFRVDHLNVLNNASTFLVVGQYGLLDHVLYNASGDYTFMSATGDFPSGGYANWQDTTNFGTSQYVILEDSYFATGNAIMDGYFGCKETIRYSQISLVGAAGINHGLDSGGYRGCPAEEIYNNKFTSVVAANQSPFGERSAALLFHDNDMEGTLAWGPLELDYYRIGNVTDAPDWGLALAAVAWTPTTVGAGSAVLNPPAPAWVTSHSYAANATAKNAGFNFLNLSGPCTSGASAPTNSTAGGTSNDGGCNWENIAGGTASPPGTTGTNAGFLSTDNETTCSSGVNCTRPLDTIGGYPFRDQPCVFHGQSVYGCYQWNNSGTNQPAAWWATDAASALQHNRDYFDTAPGGYTPYTYPDPLQGTVNPLFTFGIM